MPGSFWTVMVSIIRNCVSNQPSEGIIQIFVHVQYWKSVLCGSSSFTPHFPLSFLLKITGDYSKRMRVSLCLSYSSESLVTSSFVSHYKSRKMDEYTWFVYQWKDSQTWPEMFGEQGADGVGIKCV